MNIQKLVAYILILTLLAPPILYKVGFDHAKHRAKTDARLKFLSGISAQELVQLRITRQTERELEWKHSREFRFRGRMYDIVRIETDKMGTLYTVWPDAKESALYQKFQHFLNDFAGGQPLEKGKSLLIQNLLKAYYVVFPFLSCAMHVHLIANAFAICVEKNSTLIYLPSVHPPPEHLDFCRN